MINEDDEELRQLPFDFGKKVFMGREDFMISACNQEAFDMLNAWPDWYDHGLVIYGPAGCGKSHLAHLFADKVARSLKFPSKVSLLDARRIHLRSVNRIAHENQSIVIENLTPKADMEALFHLFNIYNSADRYMLWTSEYAPSRMHFALKDLQSRLNMLPSIEIKSPDDKMMRMLVVKLFNDRQIMINPETLDYIVLNARRSFKYIRDLVEEIDQISLAYQSAVNAEIVKMAMDILYEKEEKQLDLFEEY